MIIMVIMPMVLVIMIIMAMVMVILIFVAMVMVIMIIMVMVIMDVFCKSFGKRTAEEFIRQSINRYINKCLGSRLNSSI